MQLSNIAASDYSFFFCVGLTGASLGYLFDAQTGRLVLASEGPNTGEVGFYDGEWTYGSYLGTGWKLISFILDGSSNGVIYVNGVFDGSGAYTQKAIGGARAIGSRYDGSATYFNGDIGEIIVYNRAVSEAERQAIENYINMEDNFFPDTEVGLGAIWHKSLPIQSVVSDQISEDIFLDVEFELASIEQDMADHLRGDRRPGGWRQQSGFRVWPGRWA